MNREIQSNNVIIIIVNYNGSDDTIECLNALIKLKEHPLGIIVVDNASNNDSVAKIFNEWSKISNPILINENNINNKYYNAVNIIAVANKNNGYAAGNNIGIKIAFRNKNCKSIWLINNDTIPDKNALSELCFEYNKYKCPYIIGSTLIYNHDRKTVQCLSSGLLNKFIGTTKHIKEGLDIYKVSNIDKYHIDKKINYVNGASIFIHKDIITKTGLLNEKFFMYYEDVEFCIRAKKYNFGCLWAPKSIVYHKEGASSKKFNNLHFLTLRNRIFFTKIHYPWFLFAVCLSYFLVIFNKFYKIGKFDISIILRSIYEGLKLKNIQ